MNDYINSITKHILGLHKSGSLMSATVIEVYNSWATSSGYVVLSKDVPFLIRYIEDIISIIKMAGTSPFERSLASE